MTRRIDTAATDDVVLACLWSMLPRGFIVTASVRDVERRTLIPRGSVGRSLKRLASDGRIEQLPGAQVSRNAANRYRLFTGGGDASPLWSRQGLGATAGRVYALLSTTSGLKVAEVAALVGCTPRTARQSLQRLLSAGLVDHDEQKRFTRFEDAEYFAWYEQWLCREALESTARRVAREQFQWNRLMAPRERGPLLAS